MLSKQKQIFVPTTSFKLFFFIPTRRFLDVVKGTAKVKISNRKDSGREDAASEDTNCPDESTSGSGVASSSLTHPAEVNKSPTTTSSHHQDVLSAAKEHGAPTKSPEPTSAANTPASAVPANNPTVAAAATSQVPSASSAAVASKTSSAKSHSSQSASMVSSWVKIYCYFFCKLGKYLLIKLKPHF